MMRFWCAVLLFSIVNVVYCQWANRVDLVDFNDYFNNVITATVRILEDRGWSSLKLDEYTIDIDEEMYRWHVTGNATYTNGFLVSVEMIDVSNVAQTTSSRTEGEVIQTLGVVHGRVNFRNLKVGYDVLAQLEVEGDRRFTGTFVHTLAQYQFWTMKNLHTQEITVSSSLLSFSGGLDRMIYMPASNLTEVISRSYTPSRAFDSVSTWGRDVIAPIILDVATNQIPFPQVCLDCR